MKRNIIITLGLIGTLAFNSCSDDLDINTDPDTLPPSQLPLSGELPGGVTGVAASAGSYYALIGGMWSQFYTQSAVANQYKNIDDYSMGTADFQGAWSSMYDALLDIRNVKKNAELAENWNYFLMASVMEVYASQIMVDMYGAIPFTEANNPAILAPVFDSPETIYDGMATILKTALSKDLESSAIGGEIPGTDDLVFEGDMDKWTQFANTLLLKVYLRQTEVRPSVAQAGVQSLAGASFLTEDAAITQFVDEASRSNPLYETDRRQLNVATNLRASTTLGTFLETNSDTRLASYYDGTTFQDQGDFDNAGGAGVSVVILNATDPVYFISAAESYFLQAEAALRYGIGNAQALYEEGVIAAFNQFGLDGSSFVSGAYAYPAGSMEENLEAIIVQKWISFFPGKGYESFIEQNRTGYPMISSVAQDNPNYVPGQLAYSLNGITGGQFPKRIVYPQSETSTNSNAPALVPITTSVWYDAN